MACAPFGAPAAPATSADQRPIGIDAMNSRAILKSSESPLCLMELAKRTTLSLSPTRTGDQHRRTAPPRARRQRPAHGVAAVQQLRTQPNSAALPALAPARRLGRGLGAGSSGAVPFVVG